MPAVNAANAAKSIIRVARLLKKGTATISVPARAGSVMLEGGDASRCVIDAYLLEIMNRRGLLRRSGNTISLSDAGHSFLLRQSMPDAPFASQHRMIENLGIEMDGNWQSVNINIAESPLAMLARRKDAKGRPYLEEHELLAGERLRADYTRGSIMPTLGINWQSAPASCGRSGNSGGFAELTDAALAARMRVEKAIEAIGPELSGVLVDICCFLKGMETIESERAWPPRSAKIVLKAALSALSRHYGYMSQGQASRLHRKILHWGDAGYRPAIKGGGTRAGQPA